LGNVEIYWFSGTGNSLALARDLAVKTGAQLTPLAPLIQSKTIISPAEAIGLVFPVYDFKAPAIIENFVTRFEGLGNKYLFALCTYGISPFKCLVGLKNQLAAKSIVLKAGFAVMMPHNAVGNTGFSNADRNKALAEGKKRIDYIAQVINNRQIMPVETELLFSALFLHGLLFKVIKPVIPLLLHTARYGWESLAFQINDRCSGCATCSKVCPVSNVTMDNNRPVWGNNCLSCFACIQWCPCEAIQLGTGEIKVERYHHPEIKSSDLNYARHL
jgi:Na+-translocating ferredoxin:NAD+ oxidoreductase RNF subunit RnfB